MIFAAREQPLGNKNGIVRNPVRGSMGNTISLANKLQKFFFEGLNIDNVPSWY